MQKIFDGCEFKVLSDIEAEAVTRFLKQLRKEENLGARTYNHYLQAINAFCNWCVETRRLASNPLAGIERLNNDVDVRHKRRALSEKEIEQLIQSALGSGCRIQGYSGEERAKVYLLSYMTGLRRKELGSLCKRSFDLSANPPTVTVEAKDSKHKKTDVLPLHPDIVRELLHWLKGHQPNEKLFPKLELKKTWLMVKKDLKRVGITYKNDDGVADFHAAGRHIHITELLRNGCSIPEVQRLARHSDVRLTMRSRTLEFRIRPKRSRTFQHRSGNSTKLEQNRGSRAANALHFRRL